MRYAGLIKNDFADGVGTSVSFWTQGCPHKCAGCHNPQTWDFNGGEELPSDILQQIDSAIIANNIKRNFSILGGEPFCEENITLTYLIIEHVRRTFPDITIYVWTGYTLEELKGRDEITNSTLRLINVLIDGPFIKEQRDITLPLRGSKNQRVLYKGINF